MADRDPIQPIHEPTLAVVDEELTWVHNAADRFENASAEDLLDWAIETFHPRLAISAAGGLDGMALVDMAWRIDPSIRVFTLDTGRLPPETYTLVRGGAGPLRDRRRVRGPGRGRRRVLPERERAERDVSQPSTSAPRAARSARSSR